MTWFSFFYNFLNSKRNLKNRNKKLHWHFHPYGVTKKRRLTNNVQHFFYVSKFFGKWSLRSSTVRWSGDRCLQKTHFGFFPRIFLAFCAAVLRNFCGPQKSISWSANLFALIVPKAFFAPGQWCKKRRSSCFYLGDLSWPKITLSHFSKLREVLLKQPACLCPSKMLFTSTANSRFCTAGRLEKFLSDSHFFGHQLYEGLLWQELSWRFQHHKKVHEPKSER